MISELVADKDVYDDGAMVVIGDGAAMSLHAQPTIDARKNH